MQRPGSENMLEIRESFKNVTHRKNRIYLTFKT